MPEFLADLVAKIAFRLGRYYVLHRSDHYIAARLKFVRRVVFAVSGDEFLRNVISEAIEVFEQSGWGTALVRRMMREANQEYATAILRSILRAD
jgi:hypothetical protein